MTDLNMVNLTNINKVYQNKVNVLKNINIKINRGEFIVIMGTSGSGKTTLLNLIGGFDYPTSGHISIGEYKVSSKKEREIFEKFRRKYIGCVFQFYNLISSLTAQENIAIPLILNGEDRNVIKDKSNEMLNQMGLGISGKRFPHELSGGQQQRVALARALVNKPAILLADEPTGNLDYNTSIEIIELLKRINEQQNQTIILVTHDPIIASYGDRILFIRDGQIVEEYSAKEGSLETNKEQIINYFYSIEGNRI